MHIVYQFTVKIKQLFAKKIEVWGITIAFLNGIKQNNIFNYIIVPK